MSDAHYQNRPTLSLLFNLCFCLICLFLPRLSYSAVSQPLDELEIGKPTIRNFSANEYNAYIQNWAVVQGTNNLVYFANSEGVLEYDGVNWRTIPVKEGISNVRSLAVDDNSGRIYVGASGELGYLTANPSGKMSFVSMLDRLSENDRDFSRVWNTFYTTNGAVFRTKKKLFRISNSKVDVWESNTSFNLSFQVDDRVFIFEDKAGLKEIIGEQLVLIKDGETLANSRVFFILPWEMNSKNGLLIGTRDKGLLFYNEEEFVSWSTHLEDSIKFLYKAALLPDGSLALGTLDNGILITNKKGQLIRHINKANGLIDNSVYSLYLDHANGLWVATDNGLSRIEYDTSSSQFDESLGLDGFSNVVIRHNNMLFVGTNSGLYVLEKGVNSHFKAIDEVKNMTLSLVSSDDSLIIGNYDGVYEYKDNRVTKILTSETVFKIVKRAGFSQSYFLGLKNGLYYLSFENKQWQMTQVGNISNDVRSVEVDNNRSLWLTTNKNEVLRVRIPPEWPKQGFPTVQNFKSKGSELNVSDFRLISLGGSARFLSGENILKYNSKIESFESDEALSKIYPAEVKNISRIKESPKFGYWIVGNSKIAETIEYKIGLSKLENNGLYSWHSKQFSGIKGAFVEPKYTEGNVGWIRSEEGLFRVEFSKDNDNTKPFQVLLRRVITGDGNVLYAGAGQPKKLKLKFSDNRLRFEFSATSFDSAEKNTYQVKLDGADNNWSTWSLETFKDYSNLWEGNYRLYIRAKNRYGKVEEKSVYEFEITPPWFRTITAYSIYALCIFLLFWIFLRWRTHRLNAQKKLLKLKVRQRTTELYKKTKELEAKTKELQVAYKKMEEISVTDSLTGLKNRHFLNIYMDNDIKKLQRDFKDWQEGKKKNIPDSQDIIFFLIDIDHFKAVNDTYGHTAGDQVLIQIKRLLSSIFRESDFLIRWGGEEFLVVARFTHRDSAPQLAERVRRSIEEHNFIISENICINKSCSIGFACFPFLIYENESIHWKKVIDIADHCLYAAKISQRNAWVGVSEQATNHSKDLFESIKLNAVDTFKNQRMKVHTSIPDSITLQWQ